MIGSLRGRLLDRTAGEVLVEVCGVGYRVTVTPSTSVDLGALGDEVFVHVHHHVREDAQTLYGFATRDERMSFEALIGAHGVGPSLALAILSVHSPAQLRAALAADDVAALCLVPGVGKKTAARLLVELKSRLDLGDVVDLAAVTGTGTNGSAPAPSPLADVRDALANLGYGPDEIRDVLADLPAAGEAGELVRMALQRLAVRA
jgi:Holliday junction DNA helicase RuvA